MTDEVELAVTVTVKNGVRHAFVEWLTDSAEAMEIAIGIACGQAAAGYEFQGISLGESGEQQLWLAQRKSSTQTNHSTP